MSLPRPVNTADFYLQAILAVLTGMDERLASVEAALLGTATAEPAAPAEPEPKPTDRPALTPLPEKFPGRGILVEAGIEYVEDVPDADGLAAILGLNRATIKRILEATSPKEAAA